MWLLATRAYKGFGADSCTQMALARAGRRAQEQCTCALSSRPSENQESPRERIGNVAFIEMISDWWIVMPLMMHGGNIGWWIVMVVMMVLFWGGVIAVAVWGIRQFAGGRDKGQAPLDIAKERLARGEITKEEFDRIRGDLV